ncbi:MAG: S1C family serine protease [Isosphaerales bacterium]
MLKGNSSVLAVLFLLVGSAPVQAQHKPEVIERGKKATALVEIKTAEGQASGSAFCVDASGLFITNAHVVRGAGHGKDDVRLVVDIGRKTQRSLRAKVLRADDSLDLALLKVDADAGLNPLELGKEDTLRETTPVVTFGFPFGRRTIVGRETYPDMTVLPSRITSLRRDNGRLEGVQFDGQLNPGNSGGPVVDEAGRVIGVAVATVRGAAMNLAIPVGRLSEFLTAPGLVFDPPPLLYNERSRPVTWTIKVQPATPEAKLPDKLSVNVTVANGIGEPHVFTAQPVGNGVFKVKVTPVPRDHERQVGLDVRSPNGQAVQVQVKDGDVKVGAARFMLSDLRILFGGPAPRAQTARGRVVFGPIIGLGKVKTRVGKKTVTIDLNLASQIIVHPLGSPPPVQAVEALVEAKQGSKVLATVLKRADLGGAPGPGAVAVRVGRNIVIVPERTPMIPGGQGPSDDGLVTLGGELAVDGVPRGAGKAIRPPAVDMGEARVGSWTRSENAATPLVRTLESKLHDVAVGGGGRYLVLTLKEARKLVVFDVNTAEVVKTITLPSENTMVVAGAATLVIAFPDQALFQRWDLETMTRQGASFPSPIKGRLKGLAMGNDSDGPLLAVWSPDSRNNIPEQARFSFLDPKTFKVLKAGPITNGGFQGIGSVSASGGSILLHPSIRDRVHVRTSAGGDLYGIWHTDSMPSGFQTLAVHGATLKGIYNHDGLDQLAPGPDGHTVYTGRGGALDADGKPVRGGDSRPGTIPELTIPSPDAAYYLSINGLSGNIAPHAGGGTVSARITASVHAASDGIRLLTVRDLDEMDGAKNNESSTQDDFTVEKRFHFVPAANLLVTIPFTNDRLVLRRLDIRKALDKLGTDYLVVTTPSNLYATAGKTLDHQIEALSKAGGIRCTVAQGPDGLTVSPTGKLTWLSPKSPASGDVVTAVVTVADSTGTERFHTLRIRVN